MSLKITENARDRSRGTLSPPSGAVGGEGEGEVSQTECTQCTPSPFVKSQVREDKRTPRRPLQFFATRVIKGVPCLGPVFRAAFGWLD